MFLVMILMISGFFGQCMMTVNTMAMGHQMTEDSNMGGCDGVCNVDNTTNKEELVLFKSDPLEPEVAVRGFVYRAEELPPLSKDQILVQIEHLSYLPPGTHSEGIRLRI
jgi:hypothetical protein